MKKLYIKLFSDIEISSAEGMVSDEGSRSKKVWLLLAYLLYHHNKFVPASELVKLLWHEEESSSDPFNALKAIFYRVRGILNQIEPGLGGNLIIYKDGKYGCNQEYTLYLDCEDFEKLCKNAENIADSKERLNLYMEALSIYHGEFLKNISSDLWVIPLNTYYHNLYISSALNAIELLETFQMYEEIVALCKKLVVLEPYNEIIYRYLIQNLILCSHIKEAVKIYDDLSKLLLDDFGVKPQEETRILYREALKSLNSNTISHDIIIEDLQEKNPSPGAFVCDYDFFRILYQAESRAIARSGDATHMLMINLSGNMHILSRRSLIIAMDNMENIIRNSLRTGDIISRCSQSQFVIILPRANYESTAMIFQRIEKVFIQNTLTLLWD